MREAQNYRTLSDFSNQSLKFVPLNAYEDYQREAHWKAVEAVRRGFYGSNTNIIHQGLRAQLDHVLKNVRGVRRPQEMIDAARAATRQIQGIYRPYVEDLYKKVIPRFAEMTRQDLQKASGADYERPEQWERENRLSLQALHRVQRQQIRLRYLRGFWVKQNQVSDPWTQAALTYVRSHTGILISSPSALMRQSLLSATQDAVSEGLAEGWAIDKIVDKIVANVEEGAISRWRARRIARTETIRASNFGQMVAANESGLSLWKQWVATLDDRVRPTHEVAHNQVVKMGKDFNVGGYRAPYPAAPILPASEAVNCRCTVSFLSEPPGDA